MHPEEELTRPTGEKRKEMERGRNAEEIKAAMMPWIPYVLIGDMPHELSHLVVELSVVPGR